MGLFSKKSCSICGGDAGRIFTKKLDDGVLCKDCVSKLSPWFSDRRSATVAQIEKQLAYREANWEKVDAFQTTRTFDGRYKVLFDDNARRFTVVRENSWRDDNPDIFEFSDIVDCTYEIKESKRDVTPKPEEGAAQNGQTAQTAAQAVSGANAANIAANAAVQAQQAQAFAQQQQFAQQQFAQSQMYNQPQGYAMPPQGAPYGQPQGFGMPPQGMYPNQPVGYGMPQQGMYAAPQAAYGAPYGDPKFLDPKYRIEADGKIYLYDYDFVITISINNPFFSEIEYQVNDKTIDLLYGPDYQECLALCESIRTALLQAKLS